MLRAGLVTAFLLLVAAQVGCDSKHVKDCKSGGYEDAPVEMTAPWKDLELPLEGGTVCKSDSEGIFVTFSKGGNWTETMDAMVDRLEALGWTLHDAEAQKPIGGDYGGALVMLRKADEKHDLGLVFNTYPRDVWKDQPFTVSVRWRGRVD